MEGDALRPMGEAEARAGTGAGHDGGRQGFLSRFDRDLRVRVWAALAFGGLLGLIAYLTGWFEWRVGYDTFGRVRFEQNMRYVQEAIEAFRGEHGRLPDSLAELITDEAGRSISLWGNPPMPRDAWGNVVIYLCEGDSYQLVSYGQDCVPGGVGRNCDWINGQPVGDVRLPWSEFMHVPIARGLSGLCAVAGAGLAFFVLRGVRRSDWGMKKVLLSMLYLFFTAAVFAWLITVLHFAVYSAGQTSGH